MHVETALPPSPSPEAGIECVIWEQWVSLATGTRCTSRGYEPSKGLREAAGVCHKSMSMVSGRDQFACFAETPQDLAWSVGMCTPGHLDQKLCEGRGHPRVSAGLVRGELILTWQEGCVVLRAQPLEPAWIQILPLFLTGCVTMVGDLASPGLSFLISKMKIIVPTSWAVVRIKGANAWKPMSDV